MKFKVMLEQSELGADVYIVDTDSYEYADEFSDIDEPYMAIEMAIKEHLKHYIMRVGDTLQVVNYERFEFN